MGKSGVDPAGVAPLDRAAGWDGWGLKFAVCRERKLAAACMVIWSFQLSSFFIEVLHFCLRWSNVLGNRLKQNKFPGSRLQRRLLAWYP